MPVNRNRDPSSRPLRSLSDLETAGLVSAEQVTALETVAQRYATAITPEMAALINPRDPNDPIAAQFVPTPLETREAPGEDADPIGDDVHTPVPGIVHRYPDRVLLKAVHACPVYCRFCFRRESVGPGGEALTGERLDAAIAYIARTPAIWEVILTGGDPMMLSPRRLQDLVARLSAIDHVGCVRLHSRVPVVDPGRIDRRMVDALRSQDAAVWVSIHTNHPRELTAASLEAIAGLVDGGIPLVSQTVLLKGINDDPDTLEALFRALVRARVKPYYLHHADLAPGTGHFRTGLAEGRRIVEALRGRVSGLCRPDYVLDIPGGHGKVPAGAAYARGDDATGWTVTDPWGCEHAYAASDAISRSAPPPRKED